MAATAAEEEEGGEEERQVTLGWRAGVPPSCSTAAAAVAAAAAAAGKPMAMVAPASRWEAVRLPRPHAPAFRGDGSGDVDLRNLELVRAQMHASGDDPGRSNDQGPAAGRKPTPPGANGAVATGTLGGTAATLYTPFRPGNASGQPRVVPAAIPRADGELSLGPPQPGQLTRTSEEDATHRVWLGADLVCSWRAVGSGSGSESIAAASADRGLVCDMGKAGDVD